MKERRSRKGFTLIEILTVVLIIGLLGAFVAPRVFKGLGKAKRDIAVAKMAILENALAQFYFHCGRFPTEAEGLDSLIVGPPDLEGKWAGRYCKQSDLFDPWGNRFLYFEGSGTPGDREYVLVSLGADGLEGGDGDNEDITND